MSENIHLDQPVLRIGTTRQKARLLVILFHGRGATADSMLKIAEALDMEGVHFLIPQAAHNRWYPQTAFGPLEVNEPDLTSALSKVDTLVKEALADGFSPQQIFLGGFSQGACLASEYVARNPRKYGGLFVFSGALIGPPGEPRTDAGDLEYMPVFIGGSDVDPWIKHDWMNAAAKAFQSMGADVDFRTYPGMAHTINEEELNQVRSLIHQALRETNP